MVNYNNSAGSAALPTSAINLTSAQFPVAKRFSPSVPKQSLPADMYKSAGGKPSAHLSVGSLKQHPVTPTQLSYSTAFALPAQSPGQPLAGLDKIGRQNLLGAHKKKAVTPTVPSRSRPDDVPGPKPENSGCSLTPCSREKNNTVVFPQAEALSTVMGGQSVNFGEALLTENTVVGHEANSDIFFIKDAGIYELRYSLNYEVSASCLLLFGFESFPQSYFKQQITFAPSRGKLNATVRLLLDTGTALRLVLVDNPGLPTAGSALVSNAMLEIKQLYGLKLDCPAYTAGNPEKNFQSENGFLPTVRM